MPAIVWDGLYATILVEIQHQGVAGTYHVWAGVSAWLGSALRGDNFTTADLVVKDDVTWQPYWVTLIKARPWGDGWYGLYNVRIGIQNTTWEWRFNEVYQYIRV